MNMQILAIMKSQEYARGKTYENFVDNVKYCDVPKHSIAIEIKRYRFMYIHTNTQNQYYPPEPSILHAQIICHRNYDDIITESRVVMNYRRFNHDPGPEHYFK